MECYKERDYYFDNAKFILIILVVFAHSLRPLIEINITFKIIYTFIYTFHMPVFVFISGYFSKIQYKFDSKYCYIYIIFQVLYCIFFNKFNFPLTIVAALIVPYWIMWYIYAVMIWRIVLPLIIKLRHPILLSFVMSIIAGYIININDLFSLSRIFTFLSYFLIGYYAKQNNIKIQINNLSKIIALILISFLLLLIVLNSLAIDYNWLYGLYPYKILSHNEWYASIYRLGVYIICFYASILFLLLVPNKKTIYSSLGSNTICAYLVHGFIVKLLLMSNIYRYINNTYGIIILALFSILLALLLLSEVSKKIFIYLTSFDFKRLKQKKQYGNQNVLPQKRQIKNTKTL